MQAFYFIFGGWIMRAARISADEQFRLIIECRASGLTDHVYIPFQVGSSAIVRLIHLAI
jgi:hypothetical protein